MVEISRKKCINNHISCCFMFTNTPQYSSSKKKGFVSIIWLPLFVVLELLEKFVYCLKLGGIVMLALMQAHKTEQ